MSSFCCFEDLETCGADRRALRSGYKARTSPAAQLRENVKTPGSWVILLMEGRPTSHSLGEAETTGCWRSLSVYFSESASAAANQKWL